MCQFDIPPVGGGIEITEVVGRQQTLKMAVGEDAIGMGARTVPLTIPASKLIGSRDPLNGNNLLTLRDIEDSFCAGALMRDLFTKKLGMGKTHWFVYSVFTCLSLPWVFVLFNDN